MEPSPLHASWCYTNIQKFITEVDKVMKEADAALDAYKIKHADLEFLEELGHGAFGTVFKGKLCSRTTAVSKRVEVAIKTVRTTKVTEDTIKEFMK